VLSTCTKPSLKDAYYKAMGFDLETPNPPDELIARLGIET
jgi:hypothetical protein